MPGKLLRLRFLQLLCVVWTIIWLANFLLYQEHLKTAQLRHCPKQVPKWLRNDAYGVISLSISDYERVPGTKLRVLTVHARVLVCLCPVRARGCAACVCVH